MTNSIEEALMDQPAKTDGEVAAYAAMLREQGVWADGCAILTCGATTGHFVKPIAFCDCPETAAILAEAFGGTFPIYSMDAHKPEDLGEKE